MKLITQEQQNQMLKNGIQTKKDHIGNHWPVVKLFMPDGDATWLLSELNPEEPDIAFGLCDLGYGFPELGYVRLSEIARTRGTWGLPVLQDRHFQATKSILEYSTEALEAGRIVTTEIKTEQQINEFIENVLPEIQSDIGDLVHYSTSLSQQLWEYGWPTDNMSAATYQHTAVDIYANARCYGKSLPFSSLVVYIAAFADILKERLKA